MGRRQGFQGRELAGAPGCLDVVKVCCCWCTTIHSFHPTHKTTHRARVHARVLGWVYRELRGWQCPRCVSSRNNAKKRMEKNTQITLPGFGALSKNAR